MTKVYGWYVSEANISTQFLHALYFLKVTQQLTVRVILFVCVCITNYFPRDVDITTTILITEKDVIILD